MERWGDYRPGAGDSSSDALDEAARLRGQHRSQRPQRFGEKPGFQCVHRWRAQEEYKKLSKTPDGYKEFHAQITKMWDTQPAITAEQLEHIKLPVWIVDADHDEAIKRENTLFMADHIPNAALLIQPAVSHFSMLQDPKQFASDVLHFLATAR